jgi:hypothetical protein
MAYFGFVYYGILALIEGDESRRRAVLGHGEALLSGNVVAHNHLLFRKDAIEASMLLRDWEEPERHATALEDFVRPEPLPWTGFIIRARLRRIRQGMPRRAARGRTAAAADRRRSAWNSSSRYFRSNRSDVRLKPRQASL